MADISLLNQDRSMRIFISSTFRDMMPERELLLKRIFPQLRKLCEERHVELIEVDLRWGITEEEARFGRVIDICLSEIDRSRPYFIGILGDRYGWVPESLETSMRERLLDAYPWIEADLSSGLSITDIEMLSDEIPADFAAMCEALPMFLAQTGTRGNWVLVLDGVNQLEAAHTARQLPALCQGCYDTVSGWLP